MIFGAGFQSNYKGGEASASGGKKGAKESRIHEKKGFPAPRRESLENTGPGR